MVLTLGYAIYSHIHIRPGSQSLFCPQIPQVFCDKGAERKARDEERRAIKRRSTVNGKRRLDEMYHTPTERSEFYAMQDLGKPPVLFTPSGDPADKQAAMEFGGTELPR